MKKKFYGVRAGRTVGVFESWEKCQSSINGYSGAVFKGFKTHEEARTFVNGAKSLPAKSGKSRISKSDNSRRNQHTSNITTHGDYRDVFTDGATTNNGKKGAKSGWGIYYGPNDSRNACGRLETGAQTNQRAELTAISEALEQEIIDAEDGLKGFLRINTDSSYCIKCITMWVKKWQKNGWQSANGDVKNQTLIMEIMEKLDDLKEIRQYHQPVIFKYVPGHAGIPGNEAADRLAKSAISDR